MDKKHHSTTQYKCKHLSMEERLKIEIRCQDGWKPGRIAKELGRSYNTIKNELRRGTVQDSPTAPPHYSAKAAERRYREKRKSCRRKSKFLVACKFIQYVEERFRNHWSLDACFGYAIKNGLFPREEMVCTKTLYCYVDMGLISIRNIDLPEKVSRNTKQRKTRENRIKYGDSISTRPESVETREEFGHWEGDTVIGSPGEGEPCVVTLVERKTDAVIWEKAEAHTKEAVESAIRKILAQFGDRAAKVFRSITVDNGSEFATLSGLKDDGIQVYYTHPYSAWERGINECHNRMLRRFLPKGKSLRWITADDIAHLADWANTLPRRRLGYAAPDDLFEAELDRIYTP